MLQRISLSNKLPGGEMFGIEDPTWKSHQTEELVSAQIKDEADCCNLHNLFFPSSFLGLCKHPESPFLFLND